MKKALLTILIFLCSMFVTGKMHPVHVSVINIQLEGLLVIVDISTFSDDWETAYYHYTGDTISFRRPGSLNKWFEEYLDASFKISIGKGKEPVQLERKNTEFDDLSMRFEMRGNLKKQSNSLYIYNSILTDIFADQTNLLIYSVNGREKGIKFDYKKREAELSLN